MEKERKKKKLGEKKKRRNLEKKKKKSPGSLPSLLECQTPGALDRRWLGITGGLVTYPVILLVSEFPKESYRHIGCRLRKSRIRLHACASNTRPDYWGGHVPTPVCNRTHRLDFVENLGCNGDVR